MFQRFLYYVHWLFGLKRSEHDKLSIQESGEEIPPASENGICDNEDDSVIDYIYTPFICRSDGVILIPIVYKKEITRQCVLPESVKNQRKLYIREEQFREIYEDAVRREYQEDKSTNAENPEDLHEENSYVKLSQKQIMEIISNRGDPVTPGMESYEARVNSFKNCPLDDNFHSEKAAAAGFFYQGINRNSECYFCGLTIYEWEDPPDIEHIQLSPTCHFVRSQNSPERIRHILFQRKPNHSDIRESKTLPWTNCGFTAHLLPNMDEGNDEFIKHLPHEKGKGNHGLTEHILPIEDKGNHGLTEHILPTEGKGNHGLTEHILPKEGKGNHGLTEHILPKEGKGNQGLTEHILPKEGKGNHGLTEHILLKEDKRNYGLTEHILPTEDKGNRKLTNDLRPNEDKWNHDLTEHILPKEDKVNRGPTKHFTPGEYEGNLGLTKQLSPVNQKRNREVKESDTESEDPFLGIGMRKV